MWGHILPQNPLALEGCRPSPARSCPHHTEHVHCICLTLYTVPPSPHTHAQALLARQTSGFSGADLANLVNEAALLAAKQGADAITSDMVDYAFDKVGVDVCVFFVGGGGHQHLSA